MKPCGKCGKTVYPTEELKCLDKIWHKSCFKCQECNMTLNMKNYKGFDKMPYCNAHYPTLKATPVVDTPESKRLAENTKIQSQAVYHKDHEENMRKFTVVSDDPEMLRNLENSQKFSTVKYGLDREEMRGKKLTISDDPETRRIKQNTAIISQAEYRGAKDQRSYQESNRDRNTSQVTRTSVGSDSEQYESNQEPPRRSSGHTGGFSYGVKLDNRDMGRSSEHSTYRAQEWQETVPAPIQNADQQNRNYQQRQASYADNGGGDQARTISSGNQHSAKMAPQILPEYLNKPADFLDSMNIDISVYRFQALYDYEAQDDDELSFKEDDVIVNCKKVDAGWWTGMVEKTGRQGMLPSNYVKMVY